jgi:hypothetical protein
MVSHTPEFKSFNKNPTPIQMPDKGIATIHDLNINRIIKGVFDLSERSGFLTLEPVRDSFTGEPMGETYLIPWQNFAGERPQAVVWGIQETN